MGPAFSRGPQAGLGPPSGRSASSCTWRWPPSAWPSSCCPWGASPAAPCCPPPSR